MKAHRLTPPLAAPHKKGSVILYVLVLVALLSTLFVGWMELMVARANTGDIFSYNVKRRIAEQNARMLLRQYLISQVLENPSRPSFMAGLPDGWGGIEAGDWAKDPATYQLDPPRTPNAFNPGGRGSYATDLFAMLNWSVTVAEASGTQVSTTRAGVAVLRTRTWDDLLMLPPSYTINATREHPAGNSPGWFECDGAGNVTILLGNDPPAVVELDPGASSIVLQGDADGGTPAILRQIGSGQLGAITFQGSNARPFLLQIEQSGFDRVDLNFPGEVWRLDAVVAENTAIQLNGLEPAQWDGTLIYPRGDLPPEFGGILRNNGFDEIYLSSP